MAAITIEAVLSGEAGEDGGYPLRIFADFTDHLMEVFEVTINGALCWSGIPGSPTSMRPVSHAELRCYTPLLPPGTYDVGIASSLTTGTAASALRVYPRDYRAKEYALRRLSLPILDVGPRRPEDEPASTGNAPGAVGWSRAIVSAIADEDDDLGGYRMTRVSADTPALTPLGAPFVWDGTVVVLTPDTSEVAAGQWLKLEDGGLPFQIETVNAGVSVELANPDGLAIPTSPTPVAIVATLTWDGTATVLASSTAELAVGLWIRNDADGQWFQITAVEDGVSAEVANPLSLTIPSGAAGSSRSTNPVTSRVTTSLPVETTLGWEESGRVVVDGVVYAYGARTADPPSLDDLAHDGVMGLVQDHTERAIAADLTRARSAMDKLRRALLVPYASGRDLDAVGRNLGVPRFPFLADEDIYRAVVRSLAYSPRGTEYAFILLLDALVGEGNYELVEDAVDNPCRVFIKLTGGVFAALTSFGKAYLRDVELHLANSATEVDIESDLVDRGAIHGIQLADEDQYDDFREQYPTDITKVEFPGDAGTPAWTLTGGTEGGDITQDAGVGIQISSTANPVYTSPEARILSTSYVTAQILFDLQSAGTWDAGGTIVDQWGLVIADGAHLVGWGVNDVDASTYEIGLRSAGTAFLDGAAAVLEKDRYYDVELRKHGESHVELWVDGARVQTLAYSAFTTASAVHQIAFGTVRDLTPEPEVSVRQVGWHAHTPDNLWSVYGLGGSTSDAAPVAFEGDVSVFVDPDDVGKRFRLRGSGSVPNAYGGNGNGDYEVASVTATDTVTLQGVLQEESLTLRADAVANRIRSTGGAQRFKFPDDLGKTVVVTGSAQGNDGSYTIAALLDQYTLEDLDSGANPLEAYTDTAELDGADLATEAGADWRLNPAFETEAGILAWEMSTGGDISGNTLTTRLDFPSGVRRVLAVRFSDVLSAQVLRSPSIDNELTQLVPSVEYSYYPFYLSDLLGFIRFYLDEVRAAMYLVELLKE